MRGEWAVMSFTLETTFRSRAEVSAITEEIATAAEQVEGAINKRVFGLRLALEEILVNHVKHGHQDDETKEVIVYCEIDDDGQCVVESRDQGAGFDKEAVPDCTDDENLNKPSGRGTMLVDSFTDSHEHPSEFRGQSVPVGSATVIRTALTEELIIPVDED